MEGVIWTSLVANKDHVMCRVGLYTQALLMAVYPCTSSNVWMYVISIEIMRQV